MQKVCRKVPPADDSGQPGFHVGGSPLSGFPGFLEAADRFLRIHRVDGTTFAVLLRWEDEVFRLARQEPACTHSEGR